RQNATPRREQKPMPRRTVAMTVGIGLTLFVGTGASTNLTAAEATRPPATFEFDVQPLLTRFGCNAGACHGKSRGQNGFALSLLAYDPDSDYAALTAEARGRRVFPADPEFSLVLRKASGEIPHGGGRKLPKGHFGYELLKD